METFFFLPHRKFVFVSVFVFFITIIIFTEDIFHSFIMYLFTETFIPLFAKPVFFVFTFVFYHYYYLY